MPAETGRLRNLINLDLSDNQISDLPDGFGQLHSLASLDLSGNQLSMLPQDLGQLHHLRYLDVSVNPLTGSFPDFLADLTSIETFDFSETALCVPDEKRLQEWYMKVAGVEYSTWSSVYSWSVACSLADDEQAALQAIYDIVGRAKGWDGENPPCTWEGVTCDWTGHVAWLNLSNTHLTGITAGDRQLQRTSHARPVFQSINPSTRPDWATGSTAGIVFTEITA